MTRRRTSGTPGRLTSGGACVTEPAPGKRRSRPLRDEGSELVEVSLGRLLVPYLNGDPVPGCSVEDRSGSMGR